MRVNVVSQDLGLNSLNWQIAVYSLCSPIIHPVFSPHQIPLPDALPKLVLPRRGAAMPASGPWTGRTPPAPHTPWPRTGDSRRHAPPDLWTRRATATVSAPHRTQVEYSGAECDQEQHGITVFLFIIKVGKLGVCDRRHVALVTFSSVTALMSASVQSKTHWQEFFHLKVQLWGVLLASRVWIQL